MRLPSHIIKTAASEVQATSFLDYRPYLDAIYQILKKRSERYTYKLFAADLGFGETTLLHQIIRSYRPLTHKTAAKITAALGLIGEEERYFSTLVDYCHPRTPAAREQAFNVLREIKQGTLTNELDQSQLAYFSQWYHPVIREMITLEGFQKDPAWIAAQLTPAIRPAQARESLALLERLGYIAVNAETGNYEQATSHVGTGDRVRGMGLLSYHQQMIDLGRDSLASVKAKRRNIAAVTVACDEETAARLKAMINMFQLQLIAEAEKASKKDQIYQFNVQLFPFTNEETK